jgi:hypothetical protein
MVKEKKQNKNVMKTNLLADIGITKAQMIKMHNYLYANGYCFPSDYMSAFGEDLELIKIIVEKTPELYRQLPKKLKTNNDIVMSVVGNIDENVSPFYYDFYSVIEDSNDKLSAFKKAFGKIPCSDYILVMLVIEEYVTANTYELLNLCKDLIMSDDKFLNKVVKYIGLKGFLEELKDDAYFISRLVGINGKYFVLASDSLKKDRYLMLKAIKNCPSVVFELGLDSNDPLVETALGLKHGEPVLSKEQLLMTIKYFYEHASISVLELDEEAMVYILNRFGDNIEVVKMILDVYPDAYQILDLSMKNNVDIVSWALDVSCVNLLSDIIEAENKDLLMKERFKRLLENDENFLSLCTCYCYGSKEYKFLAEYFGDRFLKNKDILKLIISSFNFRHIAKYVIDYYDIVTCAVEHDGYNICCIANKYSTDKKLIKLAIKTYPELIFGKLFEIDDELYNYGITILKNRD